ncbi:MAG: YfiR/HmsC family protein [Sulfurimonas sp.]|jgi:serine phosphatase RsbU (regulator of sigma subunit)
MKYIILICFLFLSTLFATNEEQVKVVYTYNFMKNIQWPNEEKLDAYNLLVITDNDDLIHMFSILSQKKRVHNKIIKPTFSSSIDNAGSYQVVYLDDKFSKNYLKIFKDDNSKNTLIISNDVNDKKNVMINMFQKNEKINFEINRANILNKNLTISPDMILLGGSEIDVAEIYRDIQSTLEQKKVEYAQLNAQIAGIKEDAQRLKHEVETQSLVLSNNLKELENQKSELKQKDKDIALKDNDIKVKQSELQNILKFVENKKAEIEEQKKSIDSNNIEYQKNLLEIQAKEKLLAKLNEDIVQKNSIVKEQETIISTKSSTISYLVGAIGLFLLLVVIIIVSYFKIMRDKKVMHEQLTDLHIAEQKQSELFKELEKAKNEVEEIHKHTRESIEYAALIQGALIPDNQIFKNFFQDYFAIWHPKDIVGGDIYLMNELNEDELILMVIDCTGHGVPGAFVTMLVKAIERQLMSNIHKNEIISPAKILSIFNRSIKNLLKQESIDSVSNAGFDGGIIYYNKKEKIIKFSGAETALFYMDENNELQTIRGSRHSVGYKKSDANFEFKEHTIYVEEGMKFYCATDGYFDQNGGEKGFPFGKKKFSEIIEKYHNESMAELQEVLLYKMAEYENMIADNDRNDDMTVVGFKI